MADVAIIGGGVSGLSAGITLLLDGHDVTIYEKNHIAGGNLTGWTRGKYRIDNCIHWLTGTNPASSLYGIWCRLGALGETPILRPESLFTCERDGKSLTLYRNAKRTAGEMVLLSPIDKNEIKDFFEAVGVMQYICGVGGEKHNEKYSFPKLITEARKLFKYYRLTAGELAERFRHPLLRDFLTAITGKDFSALGIVCVTASFCSGNGDIPEGASFGMAMRMASRFEELGGKLLCGSDVKRLKSSDGGVEIRLSDGTEKDFDYAVVCADPRVVFGKMLDLPMPAALEKKYRSDRFARFSSIQCAFAVQYPASLFTGDLMLYVPAELRGKILSDRVTFRDFSHEPSFAPEGENVIQTMVMCSEETAKQIIGMKDNNPEKYAAFKADFGRAAAEILQKRFPVLAGKVRVLDVWTPATYKSFVNSEVGSYMSFTIPAHHIPSRISCKIPGVRNIFLATQWQKSPGGLPIAAECGIHAARTVSKAAVRGGVFHGRSNEKTTFADEKI